MNLFGFIGNVINKVGAVISAVGNATSNTTITHIGNTISNAVSKFGQPQTQGNQQNSGSTSSGSGSNRSNRSSAQHVDGKKHRARQPVPELTGDEPEDGASSSGVLQTVQAGWDWLQETATSYATLSRHAEGNPEGQQVALVIATQGIPEGMDAETYLRRFAYADPDWDLDNYLAALAVVTAAMSKRQMGNFGDNLSGMARFRIQPDNVEQDEIPDSPNYCPSGWGTRNREGVLYCVYEASESERFASWLTPENTSIYLANRPTVQNTGITDLQPFFYAPAEVLNNPNITNMSSEALAALALSQVYREENWDKRLNWLHPYYNRSDDPTQPESVAQTLVNLLLLNSGNINDKRGFPSRLAYEATLRGIAAPVMINNIYISGSDSLTAGFGFGPGNQPLPMTVATARWLTNYARNNPDLLSLSDLASFTTYFSIHADEEHLLMESGDGGATSLDTESRIPIGRRSLFWNVARFVYAGARLREGLENLEGQANYGTIDTGRRIQDISAFSILGFVYAGNSAVATSNFIQSPERNKAIWAVEILGDSHPENSFIVGSDGLRFESLDNAYEIALEMAQDDIIVARELLASGEIQADSEAYNYDFLPYSSEDTRLLIGQLARDAITDPVSDQANILGIDDDPNRTYMYAPLLLEGFAFYYGEETLNRILQAVEARDIETATSILESLNN